MIKRIENRNGRRGRKTTTILAKLSINTNNPNGAFCKRTEKGAQKCTHVGESVKVDIRKTIFIM